MKKTKLRVLSLFLVMVLFVGLLPASTLAASVVEPQQTEPQETEPTEVSAEDTQPASMPEESQPQPSNPTEETEVSESTISETTDESSVPADTTEPATESVTEPVEEAATEPVPSAPVPEPEPTDVPTEPVTEPITEASTETAPETSSEAPTEPTEPLLSELKPSEIRLEPQINGPTPEGYVPLSSINTVWMQGYVYRTNESAPNFKYTYTLKDGKHTMDMDHLYIMRLHVDGRYKVAYCIEPDTPVDSGVDYGSGSNSGINGDWKSNLTRDQQKTIGLAMLYSNIHHPDNLSSVESVEWEVATQIIIWEIVIGMRNSTAPYSCTNSSLINQFDNTSKGVRYLDGTDHYLKGIRAKYDIISTDLALHLVIPSFTQKRLSDAPTHTMKQQPNGSFSVSLTDSNGVLGRYKFSSKSPVTINQSGNTLTATAPKGASWGDLSFTASRDIPNPENPACLFRIFYLDGNNQTMASPPDKSNAPYDPVPAYFKLKKEILYGTAALQKTSDSDDVENYCFKLYKHGDRKSWFAKTDRNGQAYVTDKTYNQSGNKTYVFEDLLDGEYTFLEVLSQKGAGYVFPDSWRITVTNGGKTVYDKTFGPKDFVKDANGDCRLNQISITGLTGGGKMTMTIHNRQIPGTATIAKTSDDYNVESYCFKLYHWDKNKSWFGKTDDRGQVYQTDKSYNQAGTKVYTFEDLLDGEYTFLEVLSQNGAGHVFPDSWEITVKKDGKTTFHQTFGPGDFVKDANGDCRLEKVKITGLTGGGKMTMTINNAPEKAKLDILKQADDGNIAGISFQVEEWIPGIGYWKIGTYTTDVNGRIDLPEVNVDRRYRVTEIVPDGYESEKQTQEITLKPGTNTLTFVNHPLLGSITIRKVDLQSKPLSGITFLLEYSEDDGTTWKPVVFRKESSKFMPGGCTSPGLSNGSLTTGTDGTVAFTGLAISTDKRHIQYRLTETATQPGYTLMTEPIFVGELPQDGSRDISFTAVNSGSFSMPHTGSDGFIAVPFGMTLVLLSASALTFTGRKKKKAV